jgi:hypothetical protein
MMQDALLATAGLVLLAAIGICLLPGCALNGRPMRFDPSNAGENVTKAKSWFIEGKTASQVPISCSFVEFDERGDFLEFRQHLDCQAKIKEMVKDRSAPACAVLPWLEEQFTVRRCSRV